MAKDRPLVFVGYAREDGERAIELALELLKGGAVPWIDKWHILGGEDWKLAIRRAIGRCDFFVALLSRTSVNKKGVVQEELRRAMELLDQLPPDHPFLIQARLDACRPKHPKLERLQWCNLFPDWDEGVSCILRAMGLRGGVEERFDFGGFDPVTGLFNKQVLEVLLNKEVARVHRTQDSLSVLLFSIDGYGALVREQGQSSGDRLLRAVTAFLVTNTREADFTFRYSENEFLILAPQTPIAAGQCLVQRLLMLTPDVKGYLDKHYQDRVSFTLALAAFDAETRLPHGRELLEELAERLQTAGSTAI